jgi:hypothetical protein
MCWWLLGLLELFQTRTKVHGLCGKHETAQIVFFALHGHDAA